MSLQFSRIFNYLGSKSYLHNIDPRAKVMMIISFTFLSFIFRDLSLILILLGLAIPMLYLAKIGKDFLKALQGMSFLIFFIVVLNTVVNSLNFSLVILIRITVLMLIYSVFFQTTLPEEITQSLIKFHIPYNIAFAFSLAFRFVPTMATETEIIMDAQKSRGHEIKEGGMIQQIKNFFPLLIPLLMNSIRRAFHVAEALETRAFGVTKNPNFYYPLKFKTRDWGFLFLNLLLLIGGVILFINLDQLPSWLSWNLSI